MGHTFDKGLPVNPNSKILIDGSAEQDMKVVDLMLEWAGRDRNWFYKNVTTTNKDILVDAKSYAVQGRNCNKFTYDALEAFLGEAPFADGLGRGFTGDGFFEAWFKVRDKQGNKVPGSSESTEYDPDYPPFAYPQY